MHRRPGVGTSTFVAAIVVTAVVVAAAIFASIPFSATVPKTNSEITTTTTTSTSTLTVISTSIATPVPLPSTETITVTVTATNPATLTTATSSQQTSATCTISGEPGPFYLRVVSDSNQTPIAGAQVAATNEPACPTSPTTLTFTTNNTEWYSLNSQNDYGYSLVITYAGQTYDFTANLRPISVTCASLYIPSGNTNTTITESQSTCPTTISTTTAG
jgi:hypothetical protein